MRVIASLIITGIAIAVFAAVAHSQSTITTSCDPSYTTCTTTGW